MRHEYAPRIDVDLMSDGSQEVIICDFLGHDRGVEFSFSLGLIRENGINNFE